MSAELEVKIQSSDSIRISRVDRYSVEGKEYFTEDDVLVLSHREAARLLSRLVDPNLLSEGERVHAALKVLVHEYEGYDGEDVYGHMHGDKALEVHVRVVPQRQSSGLDDGPIKSGEQ